MRILGRSGAVAQFLGQVLVAPVRDGRLEPASWPAAIRIAGAFVLVGFLSTLAHIIAAEQIRSRGTMVLVGPDLYLPASGMPVLAVGVFLSMTLLQTAALHLLWPLRILALVAGATAVGVSAMNATTTPGIIAISVVAYLALIPLHLLRLRRRFAAFELATVAVLTFCGTQLPMLASDSAARLGYETRGMVITSQLQFMWLLAVPALVTAGTALTQVSVTAGEAVGSVAVDRLGVRTLQAAIGILLAWRTWVVASTYFGRLAAVMNAEVAGSLLALLLACVIALPIIIRARRHGDVDEAGPGALAGAFGGVSFLLVSLSSLWLLLPNAVLIVPVLLVPVGASAPDWLWSIAGIGNHALAAPLSRIAAGALVLGLTWRRAARGEWLGGIIVAAFLGMQLVVLANAAIPSAPIDVSAGGLAVWLQLALLLATALIAASRRADPARLGALLAAVAILSLHDFRDILENPMAALLGFSALASVLFGVLWRLLTDGGFTREDSPRLPRPTRVLLFLANIMFVGTAVAFSALTRDATGFFDISVWERAGDVFYGTPLWMGAVLVALWKAVFGTPAGPQAPDQSPSTNSTVSSSSVPSTLV